MKTFSLWIILFSCAQANLETFEATFIYTLGDNDSRNDARQICFLEAKKRLIEKIGVYVQSESVVENYRLTRTEINSYSAAILSINVAAESFYIEQGSLRLEMTVSTQLDRNQLLIYLERIVENQTVKTKISEQQELIDNLDQKIQRLQHKLAHSTTDEAVPLRKERSIVLKEIQEYEKMRYEIRAVSKKALHMISAGMTINQVVYLIGQYRNSTHCDDNQWFYNYGNIWIWCPDKIVKGYIKLTDWTGPCDWRSYSKFYIPFKG